MIYTVLYLYRKYLTKHRCMIHLEVFMLSGGCGCGGAGVVPHTLLIVRLLVETEKRRRPRTETVGRLEHSQRELLQIKSKNVLHVFLWLIVLIFLSKDLHSTRGRCVSSVQQEGLHLFYTIFVFSQFSSNIRSKWSMLKHEDGHYGIIFKRKVTYNHTYMHTPPSWRINHNAVITKGHSCIHISVEDSDYLILTIAHWTLNIKLNLGGFMLLHVISWEWS